MVATLLKCKKFFEYSRNMYILHVLGSVHVIDKFLCFHMLLNICMYMVMFLYACMIFFDDLYNIFHLILGFMSFYEIL